MCTAALFKTAPNQKQPKCPSLSKWLKNSYISTMVICCSKRELTLDILNNSSGSQGNYAEGGKKEFQKVTYGIIPFKQNSIGKIVAIVNR